MGKVGKIMFDVWRTNRFDSNILEECVATFNNIGYARKFVDLMAEHESEEFVIQCEPKKVKELSLEEKFKSRLKDLEKDFASKERDYDFDFER